MNLYYYPFKKEQKIPPNTGSCTHVVLQYSSTSGSKNDFGLGTISFRVKFLSFSVETLWTPQHDFKIQMNLEGIMRALHVEYGVICKYSNENWN